MDDCVSLHLIVETGKKWVLGNAGIYRKPLAEVVEENTRCRRPRLIGEEQRQMLIASKN